MIWKLLVTLFYHTGVLVIVALLLSKVKLFRRLVADKDLSPSEKIALAALFGAIGVLGTYTGISIQGAIVNSRVVGIFVGGLLGGPFIGFVAGSIAGLHRYFLDPYGLTSFACMTGTIVEGAIAGLLRKPFHRSERKWLFAMTAGAMAQTVHMGLIPLLSPPLEEFEKVVAVIFIPMILVNSVGVGLIVAIAEGAFREQERLAADQARAFLSIANKTIQYFRKGFNRETALGTAEVLLGMTAFAEVVITDTEKVLARTGGRGEADWGAAAGNDLDLPCREVLESGRFRVVEKPVAGEGVRRSGPAVIVPLKEKDAVVGTLKLHKDAAFSGAEIELALGLASLFSTQIELSRIEHAERMLAAAELKALQAQINPHFFFNAMNTILSLIRTDPDRARELLAGLSVFLRRNIRRDLSSIPLDEEIEHVSVYLEIEKARFGDKLQVEIDIPAAVKPRVPPLILQPIVENAVKHGIRPLDRPGKICIRARRENGNVKITVHDDGLGMESGRLEGLLDAKRNGASIGLVNVNERLVGLFGPGHALAVSSSREEGTTVTLLIPDGREGDV